MRYALIIGYAIHDFITSDDSLVDLVKQYPSDVTLVECEEEDVTIKFQYIDGKFIDSSVGYNSKLLDVIRIHRDFLLSVSDSYMIPDFPTGELTREQWTAKVMAYRQALRDFPATCNIDNPVYPTL